MPRKSPSNFSSLSRESAPLIPILATDNEAALMLAEYGMFIDRFRVLQLLGDPNWIVRSSAIYAAVRVSSGRAQPIFLELLNDRHFIVRRDAAVALDDLGHRVTIPPLKSLLNVEKHDQAKLGLWGALIALGERKYLESMMMLYKSDAPGVKYAVWHELEELIDASPLSTPELVMIRSEIEVARRIDNAPGIGSALDRLVEKLEETYPSFGQ